MKPIEIAFEYGRNLPEFENLQKAEEYFFSLIELCGSSLKKLLSESFEVDLQYSFDFLDTFDTIVRECISSKKYDLQDLHLNSLTSYWECTLVILQ